MSKKKQAAGKAKASQPKDDDDEVSEEMEDAELEQSGAAEPVEDMDGDEAMEEPDDDDDEEEEEEEEDEDGQDSGEEDEDEDDAIADAVDSAVSAIASLPNPEAVRDAFDEVKKQVQNLMYTSAVSTSFQNILEGSFGPDDTPFDDKEKEVVARLFQRCTVLSHEVYRDSEHTLGPRRDVCGASTMISLTNKAETEGLHLCFTWYWQQDPERGYLEEYCLTLGGDEEVGEDDSEEEDQDMIAGSSSSAARSGNGHQKGMRAASKGTTAENAHDEMSEEQDTVVTILEGTRSQFGDDNMELSLGVLQAVETVIQSKLSLQSLLRFIILVTRTESEKCHGHLNSVTGGYDAMEDAQQMASFLCKYTIESADAAVVAQKSSKRKAAPGAAQNQKKTKSKA